MSLGYNAMNAMRNRDYFLNIVKTAITADNIFVSFMRKTIIRCQSEYSDENLFGACLKQHKLYAHFSYCCH